MTAQDHFKSANELERKINCADSVKRLALQPELSRIIRCLKADGQQVPPQLSRLNNALCDEAIEAWFDNMPV
jgi:hypothetical protein